MGAWSWRFAVVGALLVSVGIGGWPASGRAEGEAARERALRARLAADPGDLAARRALGRLLFEQRRYAEACPLLDARSEPDRVGCWLTAAAAWRAAGAWSHLVEAARHVAFDDWPPEAQRRWLEAATEAARKREAWALLVELYPRLLTFVPEDGRLHYLYGRALERRGRYEDAQREYELAASLLPGDPDVDRALQAIQRRLARTGAASAARIEPLELEPQVTELTGATVRFEGWSGGALAAEISVEAAEAATAAGAAVAVELLTTHWAGPVSEAEVRQRIGRWVRASGCERGAARHVELTWGPEGRVERLTATPADPELERCLRRAAREWVLFEAQHGLVRARVRWPAGEGEGR